MKLPAEQPKDAPEGIWKSRELEELLVRAIDKKYAEGSTIFRRGDAGDTMMRVKSGRVRISVGDEQGRELTFAIIGPGHMFGEIAVIDGRGRTADASALEACVVQIIQRRDFLSFLERNAQIAVRLLQMLCERVRQADRICENIAFVDLEGRLAWLLLDLAKSQGAGDGREFRLRMSQEEMGRLIMASREAVNRQLRQWQTAGVISLVRHQIVLKDLNVLRRAAADY
jgi:CRP/FNR family transcriptional regulator, cyclic AMP receptor protein